MTPGDRPSIPWETEPFLRLDAPGAGTVAPSDVVPAGGPFALEEEPALSPVPPHRASGHRSLPLSRPAAPSAAPTRAVGALPATGLAGGVPAAGVLLVGLAALARLRRRGAG
jgi:hypothetical protein